MSRVSPFLAWGDFHAHSRFARSTIPEEKWGTTRSLEKEMNSLRARELSRALWRRGEKRKSSRESLLAGKEIK